MDGLLVQGRKITTTIPTGAQGNDRPMSIVTETWYSDDLKIAIVRRMSDPRNGVHTLVLPKSTARARSVAVSNFGGLHNRPGTAIDTFLVEVTKTRHPACPDEEREIGAQYAVAEDLSCYFPTRTKSRLKNRSALLAILR